MPKKFQYSCGCCFDMIENNDQSNNVLIDFDPAIENIQLDCSKTWELISSGNTKGCFQLESRLGKSMAKKLKPQNIEQLSALISILRPGCLEAYRDGKNVSNHYIDKKNGQESVDYYHPSLEPILRNTYGEMIYQEQAMEIARVIAGFNLQEADMLRKAIGKKKPEEMAKIKLKFLEGCTNIGTVSIQQAEEIFGWIEKSQRYSFNKSHAVSYAINAYLSAYTKAHFPKIFFSAYLRFAKDKIDPKAEIKELVQNANEMDVSVNIPDIRNLNKNFILKNQKIYFGLTDIKGFGQSIFDKLVNLLKDKKLYIDNMAWVELLMYILLNINSNASKALIQAGALSFLGKSRTSMLFDFGIASELTKKECEYIVSNISKYGTISDAMHDLYHNAKINKNRKSIILTLINAINKPPYSLEDNPEWIADSEDEILGCNITCSKVDMYDITMTNTTCKDFKNSLFKDNVLLCAEIEDIGITKTKKGKNPGLEMAFVTVSDGTGLLDSVIFFPESYKMYRNLLFSGNVVILKGARAKTGDSLIVEKVYLPST
jgi:DNA polymerase-3 subunit alpha